MPTQKPKIKLTKQQKEPKSPEEKAKQNETKTKSTNSICTSLFFGQCILGMLGRMLLKSTYKRKNMPHHLMKYNIRSFEMNGKLFNYKSSEKYQQLKMMKREYQKQKKMFDKKKKQKSLSKDERKHAEKESERVKNLKQNITNEINQIKVMYQGDLIKELVEKYFNCTIILRKPKHMKDGSVNGSMRITQIIFNDETSIDLQKEYKSSNFSREMENVLNEVKKKMPKDGKYFVLEYGRTWNILNEVKLQFISNGDITEIECPRFCGLLLKIQQHLITKESTKEDSMKENSMKEEIIQEEIIEEENIQETTNEIPNEIPMIEEKVEEKEIHKNSFDEILEIDDNQIQNIIEINVNINQNDLDWYNFLKLNDPSSPFSLNFGNNLNTHQSYSLMEIESHTFQLDQFEIENKGFL